MRPTAMIHMGGSQAEGGAEDACEQGAQRDGAVVQECMVTMTRPSRCRGV